MVFGFRIEGEPMKNETPMKAVVSVSEQCRLLGMSRSHFYWHVRRGTFHAPLKLPNGRPYYTASMVEDLRARETGVGVNKEYVIFYERQGASTKPEGTSSKADHSSLLEGMKSLGLTTVTTEQIEAALAACFPKGTTGQDESSILRAVFRHLKRSGVA
jgi:predicted DNA-binding transcriptional regulator AlpA